MKTGFLLRNGDARAKGADEVGGVVVDEDARENVLRGVVGDGLVEVFGVGGGVVHKEKLDPRIEDGGVECDQFQMLLHFGRSCIHDQFHLVVSCVWARSEVIDRMDNIVNAETHEGVPSEFGTKFREIESP